MKPERKEAFFDPPQIVRASAIELLVHHRGDVEPVHDPGIVPLQFEQPQPGVIGLHRLLFFLLLEIDESASPGEIRERAPLS